MVLHVSSSCCMKCMTPLLLVPSTLTHFEVPVQDNLMLSFPWSCWEKNGSLLITYKPDIKTLQKNSDRTYCCSHSTMFTWRIIPCVVGASVTIANIYTSAHHLRNRWYKDVLSVRDISVITHRFDPT